ncbi:MAG: transposase [Candidatus Halalkalibacterium sp. M3_1C_030]
MSFYKRNLPHWQPSDADYFVTFRLAGSLPKGVIKELRELRNQLLSSTEVTSVIPVENQKIQIHQKIFQKYEAQLDRGEIGPMWLSERSVADLVQEALHHRDETEYDLYAYCIMSNHVHLVFRLLKGDHFLEENSRFSDYPVTNLMKSLKSYTAVHANRILKRSGQFWHRESYDRVIRNSKELENTINYTLNNPIKAGLVEKWEDWPYSYCKPEFLELFSNDT